MKNFTQFAQLLFALLVLAASLFGQTGSIVGVFPHYAVDGKEWSSKVYLTIDLQVTSPVQKTCSADIGLANSNSFVGKYLRGTWSMNSTPSPRPALTWNWNVESTGAMMTGPAFVYSNCPEAIKSGELVFTQHIDGKTFDASVPMQRVGINKSLTKSMIVDSKSYEYGFALYNLSPDPILVQYALSSKGSTNSVFVTLAGYEQRSILLRDVVPDLPYTLDYLTLSQANGKAVDLYMMALKFNHEGSFSTVLID